MNFYLIIFISSLSLIFLRARGSSVAYTITTETGCSDYDSYTDDDVYVYLFGNLGTTSQLWLTTSLNYSDTFQTGQTDTFVITDTDVGNITKLRIALDGSDGWDVLNVRVYVPTQGVTYCFFVDQNLDDSVEVDINATPCTTLITYYVTTYTGDGATNDYVRGVLHGTSGTSEMFCMEKSLNNSDPFGIYQYDTFIVSLPDVGNINSLTIDLYFNDGWLLDNVTVYVPSTGQLYCFYFNTWIDGDQQPYITVLEIYASSCTPICGELHENYLYIIENVQYSGMVWDDTAHWKTVGTPIVPYAYTGTYNPYEPLDNQVWYVEKINSESNVFVILNFNAQLPAGFASGSLTLENATCDSCQRFSFAPAPNGACYIYVNSLYSNTVVQNQPTDEFIYSYFTGAPDQQFMFHKISWVFEDPHFVPSCVSTIPTFTSSCTVTSTASTTTTEITTTTMPITTSTAKTTTTALTTTTTTKPVTTSIATTTTTVNSPTTVTTTSTLQSSTTTSTTSTLPVTVVSSTTTSSSSTKKLTTSSTAFTTYYAENKWTSTTPFVDTTSAYYDIIVKAGIPPVLYDQVSTLSKEQEAVTYLTSYLNDSIKRQIGFQFDDIISNCSYNEVPCGKEDFEQTYDATYGNCYSFNVGKNPRTSFKAGQVHGLRMLLKASQSNYVCSSESAGFKVVIHDNNLPPFPDSEGYKLAPGVDNLIGLTKYEIIRERTNSDCIDSLSTPLIFGKLFTAEGCYRKCFQESVQEHCGCCDPRYDVLPNRTFCTIEQKNCLESFRSCEYRFSGSECNCRASCRDVTFKSILTKSKFNMELYEETYCKDVDGIENCTSLLEDNLSMLQVYYEKMVSVKRVEDLSYDFAKLLSDISNMFGILLGFCALTVFEVMFFLIAISTTFCRKLFIKEPIL